MVALLGGAEIPVQVGMGLESTIGGGAVPIDVSEGFGPSPAESQIIYDTAVAQRAEQAKRDQLALMEATAAEAHEQYYGVGGTGYGTTPGGPDVVYFQDKYGSEVAEGVYEVLHPVADSQFFQPDYWGEKIPEKTDILLYGALAIGALALLKR